MNLSLYNLNQVIYVYIWNYFIDQSNFVSKEAIFLEDQQRIVDQYLLNNKNYISFYCDKFQSENLQSYVEIIDSTSYSITQYTSGVIKISYYGHRAFERLFICVLKAKASSRADEYLVDYGINIYFNEVFNETNILNNINKIEKASVEIKILFNAEYLISENNDYFIQKVEITQN